MTDHKKTPVADHMEQTLNADSSACTHHEGIDADVNTDIETDINTKDLAGVINEAKLNELLTRSEAFANHLAGEIESFIDDFEDDYKP